MPFLKSVINYIRCDQSFQIINFSTLNTLLSIMDCYQKKCKKVYTTKTITI